MAEQAWGVAFRNGDSFSWCYSQGPMGWSRSTKRAALMSALMSNNGLEDGPYVPLPLPGMTVSGHPDYDLQPFHVGPYGVEATDLYRRAHLLLTEKPNTDYSELPFLNKTADSDLLLSLESDIVEFKPEIRRRLYAIAARLRLEKGKSI